MKRLLCILTVLLVTSCNSPTNIWTDVTTEYPNAEIVRDPLNGGKFFVRTEDGSVHLVMYRDIRTSKPSSDLTIFHPMKGK